MVDHKIKLVDHKIKLVDHKVKPSKTHLVLHFPEKNLADHKIKRYPIPVCKNKKGNGEGNLISNPGPRKSKQASAASHNLWRDGIWSTTGLNNSNMRGSRYKQESCPGLSPDLDWPCSDLTAWSAKHTENQEMGPMRGGQSPQTLMDSTDIASVHSILNFSMHVVKTTRLWWIQPDIACVHSIVNFWVKDIYSLLSVAPLPSWILWETHGATFENLTLLQ